MKKLILSLSLVASAVASAQTKPSSIYMLESINRDVHGAWSSEAQPRKTKVNKDNVALYPKQAQSQLSRMKDIRSNPKINQLFKDLSKLIGEEVSVFTFPNTNGFWIGVGDNLATPAPLDGNSINSAQELIVSLEKSIKHYSKK